MNPLIHLLIENATDIRNIDFHVSSGSREGEDFCRFKLSFDGILPKDFQLEEETGEPEEETEVKDLQFLNSSPTR